MHRLIRPLLELPVRLFYRREQLGTELPAHGPLILVGNHPNGLVDPILLASATRRPVRFLGKAPLFELPVLAPLLRGMKVLPVWRRVDGADTQLNRRTFEAVFDALGKGDVLCLFPEGVSHSDPELKTLKTGAARMALGAEELHRFELGVTVVPVGLVYRANHRFRSQVAVWVGEAIELGDLRELYVEDEREAVQRLTERIAEGLRAVTLDLDRWEDLPLIELAERIWSRPEGGELERIQAFASGLRELRGRDPQLVDPLARRIACFRDRLQRLGISVDELDLRYRFTRILRFVLRNLSVLLLGLPLALLGLVIWWLPYRLVGWLTRLRRPSREVSATTAIFAGLLLFPTWLAGLAALAWMQLGWPWALLFLAAAPGLGLAALGLLEWRADTWAEVATFLRLSRRKRLKELLRRERDQLAAEIETLRAGVAGASEDSG